jgi:hypothetical protein
MKVLIMCYQLYLKITSIITELLIRIRNVQHIKESEILSLLVNERFLKVKLKN